MALRGNLKDFSLPDVFQLITLSKKTGVLRITHSDGAVGSVWFQDGEVFFAQSNWNQEMLGERLVAAQKITPNALEKALEIRASEPAGGRRLGQILVDEGFITAKILEGFVQEQIQDTIFNLMRWDGGEFDFELLPELVDEDIGLSVSIENMIMEGARRLEEWARIKKKIPSMDIVLKMAIAPGEGTFEISLKPVEWNLLLLVDGTRSVAELVSETRKSDFEVARIVYGLLSAGLLEFASEREIEAARAKRLPQEASPPAVDAEVLTEPEPPVIEEESPAELAPAADPVPELTGDLERDLISLGLGELVEQDIPAAPPVEPPEAQEVLTEPEPPVIEEESPAAPLPAELAPAADPVPELTGDLERDLIALGLGELAEEDIPAAPPVELPVSEEVPAAPEDAEPLELLDSLLVTEPQADESPEAAASDLNDLLDSLEDSGPEVIRSKSLDDTPSTPAAGIISTDAYLDFGTGDFGGALSGGLTDELSALTGAERPRPQARVKKIPDSGEQFELRRDQAVDKDLVLKVIDGIKRL